MRGISKKIGGALFAFLCAFALTATLQVTVKAEDVTTESENNDSVDTANALTIGTLMTGSLSVKGDVDYYKVTANQTGKLTLKFLHITDPNGSGGWKVTIYKKVGDQFLEYSSRSIGKSGSSNVALPSIGLVSGETYYISICNSDEYFLTFVGSDAYQLLAELEATDFYEKEFNNTSEAATSIVAGTEYTGNLVSASDVDYYKITAEKTGKLTLNFLHTTDPTDSDSWRITVYKEVGDKLLEYNGWSVKKSASSSVSFPSIGLASGETYYIAVYHSNTYSYYFVGDDEYRILAELKATEFYEKEFNDTYEAATSMVIGKKYTGNLGYVIDKDYFKFTAEQNGKIVLKFLHTTDSTSTNKWGVEIYKKTGDKLSNYSTQSVRKCDSSSCTIDTIGVAKGETYYIKVCTSGLDYVGDDEYGLQTEFYFNEPTNFKASSTTKSVKLSWKKVSGASGYEVYEYNAKKKAYTKIKALNSKASSYTIDKLAAAEGHKYAIRSYKKVSGKTYYSEYQELSVATCPTKVEKLVVTSTKSGKATVKFNKASGATGYEIAYSTSKKGTYKSCGTTKKNSGTSVKCTKGKTLYFKVRAYKTYNKVTYYGSWSDVTAASIKK